MHSYDKYTAIMDFIVNQKKLETMKLIDIMVRWGWTSKSITYKLIQSIKSGDCLEIKDLNKLVTDYVKTLGIVSDKKEEIKPDVPPVVEKEPLFPDEPGDTGLQYPYQSEKFKNAWAEWIEYKRTERKQKYKSIKSEQTTINKLYKDSFGDELLALDMIECSIANTWQGVYADQAVKHRHPQYFFKKKKGAQQEVIIDNPNPEDTKWT